MILDEASASVQTAQSRSEGNSKLPIRVVQFVCHYFGRRIELAIHGQYVPAQKATAGPSADRHLIVSTTSFHIDCSPNNIPIRWWYYHKDNNKNSQPFANNSLVSDPEEDILRQKTSEDHIH